LAKAGKKVVVFDQSLHTGGGAWGGGLLFPRVVIQEPAKQIFQEIGIHLEPAGEGYYTAESAEVVSKATSAAIDAGARIMTGLLVEDVMIRENRVSGVVINWGAVERAGLHVDPLGIAAGVVIDATGHEASIAHIVQRKIPGAKFPTSTGGVVGEGSMWAEIGDAEVVSNAKEIFPGLVVTGMCANAVFGSPRMGATFTGMILSGKKAAEEALKLLK
jgi:thiamine thiazole synthase